MDGGFLSLLVGELLREIINIKTIFEFNGVILVR